MKTLPALILFGMMSQTLPALAAISTTSASPSQQTMPTTPNDNMQTSKGPAATGTDSYESPTSESGDLSAKGEASASSHETQPLNHKKVKRTARAKAKINKKTANSYKENCDTITGRELCEKTNQMNRSMHERTDKETAEQRGGGQQADRSFE